MLDVGFSEILLTSAIALIVLGPERLPKVARQVGNWMGRARVMARQLSEQLEREVNAEELLKTQSKPSPEANSPSIGGANPAVARPIAPPLDAWSANVPSADASPADASPAVVSPAVVPSAPEPPAIAPEPVYGRDASFTTPAAMHANDPPVAAATDPKPPHE
jgi:sec-independent protein translocase protein TatB